MLFGPGVTELTNENPTSASQLTHGRHAKTVGIGESCTILPMDTPVDGVSIRAWKPPVPGIREVFHARFTDHAYPPHTHDTGRCSSSTTGAIRYDLDRTARAPSRRWSRSCRRTWSMTVGRPPSHGFRKRVLYLETTLLGEHLIGRPSTVR